VPDKVGPEDFMPLKLLGSGSFGEVYLVRELSTGELFAMKVLSKQKILGQNLVRYAKTELFLILDFCPGGDLGRLI
jgi:protein-serine/threonine kinase